MALLIVAQILVVATHFGLLGFLVIKLLVPAPIDPGKLGLVLEDLLVEIVLVNQFAHIFELFLQNLLVG